MPKSKTYEFRYNSGLSLFIAEELQRLDHVRTDEKFYRTVLRVGRYRRIQELIGERIEELEEAEELIEHECAVTGKEYN